MLKHKKAAARAAAAASAAAAAASAAVAPGGTAHTACLRCGGCLSQAAAQWRAIAACAAALLVLWWLLGNSGGDSAGSSSSTGSSSSSTFGVFLQQASGGAAAATAVAAGAGAVAGAAPAAALPALPSPAAQAPDSGMCTRFPFTTVGTPADAGRAGCAYGPKKQYVDAYLRSPGNEFSNSDDVVYAFVNDVAQWSRTGKHGWDKHMATKGSTLVLADVGANVGGFSRTLMGTFGVPDGHSFAQLHAFEPYPVTFKTLGKELGLPRQGAPIFLHNVALTDAATVERTGGRAEFFGAYLDINPNPTGASIGRTEEVQVSVGFVNLTTPDAFFEALEQQAGWGGLKGKEWILPLFKIDTEGQDLAVLRGMEGLLTRKNIQAITFEWGAKWQLVDPSYTLVEALKILDRHGYEAFHSGNARQGVFHWIPISCQYWDDAYLRTLEKAHNHYQGTNIFAIKHDAPFLERFRKVHVMWEQEECKPPDWQSRVMP